MRNRHGLGTTAVALVAGLTSLGCSTPEKGPASSAANASETAACPASAGTLQGEEIILREPTQPTLAGHHVGVGNIFERELPDDDGVVAPRLSASLHIADPATGDERDELVRAGSVLVLGDERHCVVRVEAGGSAPGAIAVRRLVAPAE